jgi:CHAT domain-containing protein
MGDIDYDDMDAYISESTRGDRGKLKKWNSLKGTALELASISEALSSLKDIKIDMYVQDHASEAQLKSYNNTTVNCIHLATHGFYYDNLTQNESAFNQRLFSCNMFSSAGLLLSGANKAWTSSNLIDNNTEDGILTPDEVETLSFPNLNLVVLSACETGLGAIDVDGVWGMQRSFRNAGAENLVVSLSKINDAITANFMSDFYQNIAIQKNIHDSFYLSQKKLKERYPGNPEIYSAFILIE